MNQLIHLAVGAALTTIAVACGEPAAPPATPADKSAPPATESSTSSSTPDANIAKEGEQCGDGMAGRPKTICATGLVCELNVTAPAPAAGAAQGSSPPGKCRKK